MTASNFYAFFVLFSDVTILYTHRLLTKHFLYTLYIATEGDCNFSIVPYRSVPLT